MPDMFGRKMSPYGKTIMEATGCTAEETFEIEECMRDRFRTLDGLTRPEFIAEARLAKEVVKQLAEEDARGQARP